MTADKSHPAEQGIEKSASTNDKAHAGAPITDKTDNALQQRAKEREALKAYRLTKDPGNSFKIDMGEGKAPVQDQRPIVSKAAANVIDYQPEKVAKSTFALGVDYESKPLDTRTPGEKFQEFMQAAAKKATDPVGWKSWAQGEINKFAGIGAGLNDAKEETKAAVAAGWKAMTDGTVTEFLSHPNAIDAPVFKVVENAFEAMGKDPNAVNRALETLGKVVLKASEQYGNLSDYEKGRVIGKAMFVMVNPEGSTEGGEAAIKIADNVATHVDSAVWNTANRAMKAVEEAAKSSPDIALQTKQMLLDYLTQNGIAGPQLEYAGFPRGYFEGMKPSKLATEDNYLAMSKFEDSGSEIPKRTNEATGEGSSEIQYQTDKTTGRLQRTDVGALREPYKWTTRNEHFAPDALRQSLPDSCISAVGEMLSKGRIPEQTLIARIGAPSDIDLLATALGSDWTTKSGPRSLAAIGEHGPWAAEMNEYEWTKFPKTPHVVVVDGPSPTGNVMIRDPQEGTRYEMTVQDFKKTWTGRCAYRTAY